MAKESTALTVEGTSGAMNDSALLMKTLRAKSMVAAGVGNTLEWFDWTMYATFSPYIAGAFFAKSDPRSMLLSALAVFAVGFLSRPLGGIVFGVLTDKLGRKGTLVTTVLIMSAASLTIGLMPTYASIGAWSSLLLLIVRLLQGFAHGGEMTASYAYLAEIAPAPRRAFWSSSMYVCAGLGGLIATILATVLTNYLTKDVMQAWGWRVPFIVGAVLSIAIIFMRRGMMESDVYEKDREESRGTKSIEVRNRWSRRKIIARTCGMFIYEASATLPYYVWTSYPAVFAITYRGMAPGSAFAASLGAQIINIICTPVAGWISDHVGRKPLTIFYYLANAIFIFRCLVSSMTTHGDFLLPSHACLRSVRA